MTKLLKVCDCYRQQSEKFTEMLSKIRDVVKSGTWDISLDDDGFDALDLRARTYRRLTCDPHYRVAVAGGFSTGKSELLNAFLGESILPSQIKDTTFIPTVIRRSREKSRRMFVRYLTQEEVSGILSDYRGRASECRIPLTVKDVVRASWEELEECIKTLGEKANLQKREQDDLQFFFKAIRDPKLQEYIRDRHPYERPIDSEEMEKLVVRKDVEMRRRAIKDGEVLEQYLAGSVIIDLPNLPFDEDVELIDLPGTDAGDRWAKQITHRFVREVDMMLMVVKADATFSDAAEDLFAEVQDWVGGHTERLFVVVNKADLYGGYEPNNVQGAYRQLVDGIASSLPDYSPKIIYVSAAAALESSEAHENAVNDIQKLCQTNDKELNTLLENVRHNGGVAGARKRIEEFLSGPAFTVKLDKMQAGWEQLFDTMAGSIAKEVSEARSWLTNDHEQIGKRCREALRKVDRNLEQAEIRLKAHLTEFTQSRDVNYFGSIAKELLAEARKIIDTKALDEFEKRESADACREIWPQVLDKFRDAVRAATVKVARDLESVWRSNLSTSIEELRRFHKCAGDEPQVPPPADPFSRFCDSLALRMYEVVPFTKDVPRPFPPPSLGEVFGSTKMHSSFATRFTNSIHKFFDARSDMAVDQLRRVFFLYAEWHVMETVKQAHQFISHSLNWRILVTEPMRFAPFLVGGEDQRTANRNKQIAEIGVYFDQLSRNLADSLK